MPLPLAIVAVPLFLAAVVLYFMLAYHSFRRLRSVLIQGGYKSPAVQYLTATAAFVLPYGITFLLLGIGNENGLWVILGLLVLVPATMSVAVRFLPARNLRTPGRRVARFPYASAGGLLVTLAFALLILALVAREGRLIPIASSLLVPAVTCIAISRRMAIADADTALAADDRAPVLFLRPFQSDESVVIEMPRTKSQFFIDWGRHAWGLDSRRFVSVEKYLKDEIARSIGPFIALGNPLDFIPPEGAARVYCADEEWMNRFRQLAEHAACLLIIPDSSAHLLWELQQIKRMGLHEKCFILTRPDLVTSTWRGKALRWWLRMVMRPSQRVKDRPLAWSPFAELLRNAGFDPGDDPGPGAVVTFDASACARVLTRDAKSAAETARAIAGSTAPPLTGAGAIARA